MAPPIAGVNGAWACPSCQNVNFALRDACNRCQAPKPAAAVHQLKPAAASFGAGPPIAGVDGNWSCPFCGNVNFAARLACNRCQLPKSSSAGVARPSSAPVPTQAPQLAGGGGGGGAPVAGVDGNWKCRHCGNVNYPGRVACNRCQTPKEEEPAATQGVGGHRGGAPIAGVDGNWLCVMCQNVNFAARAVCNRCQAPPPEAAQVIGDEVSEELPPGYEDIFQELLRKESEGQEAMEQMQRVQGGSRSGAPIAGVDGNWECPHCGNVNYPNRTNCNLCQVPRDAEAEPTSRPSPRAWPQQSVGGGAPVVGVDGAWGCPECQNVNYAARVVCNRCSTPKPAGAGGGGQRPHVLQWPQGQKANSVAAAPHRSPSGAPVAGLDGNWQCPICQNVNYPSRSSCNRCAAPMPSQPVAASAPRAEQPGGNWVCQSCQNVNYPNRDVCNRCKAPKSEEAYVQQAMAMLQQEQKQAGAWQQKKAGGAPIPGVDGNWQCPGCQNVNYGMRQVCNRCQAPKPDGFGGDDGAAEQQAAFAKLLQSSNEDLATMLSSHPEMFEALDHPAKRARRDPS